MSFRESEADREPPAKRRPIVPVVGSVLAAMLLVALVLIGQPVSIKAYAAGIILVLVTVLISFTFNNVPRDVPVRKLPRLILTTWAIVIILVVCAYFLAPVLVQMGR